MGCSINNSLCVDENICVRILSMIQSDFSELNWISIDELTRGPAYVIDESYCVVFKLQLLFQYVWRQTYINVQLPRQRLCSCRWQVLIYRLSIGLLSYSNCKWSAMAFVFFVLLFFFILHISSFECFFFQDVERHTLDSVIVLSFVVFVLSNQFKKRQFNPLTLTNCLSTQIFKDFDRNFLIVTMTAVSLVYRRSSMVTIFLASMAFTLVAASIAAFIYVSRKGLSIVLLLFPDRS